jgi:hypothetical protein
MMVALLLYGYCRGERSGRVIEKRLLVPCRASAWLRSSLGITLAIPMRRCRQPEHTGRGAAADRTTGWMESEVPGSQRLHRGRLPAARGRA